MLALLALVAPLALAQDVPPADDGPPTEPRVESYDDGVKKAEYAVLAGVEGDVRHGDYLGWHPNGQVAEQGRYKEGVRVAIWEGWHPNGQKAFQGNYRRGLRNGEWRYWDADGNKDGGESGRYNAVFEEWEDGTPKRQGELRFKNEHGVWRGWRRDGSLEWEGRYHYGKRKGRWTWIGRDGSPRLEGEFSRDERSGPWVFRHPNGLPDPEFVSGIYKKGERRKANPKALPAPLTPDSPWLDVAALAPPPPYPGLTENDYAIVASLLTAFVDRRDDGAFEELSGWELAALPGALERLRATDFADEASVLSGYRVTYSLIAPATNGHVFEWRAGTSAADQVANRLAVVRWSTLWELTRHDPDFWERVRATAPEAEPELLLTLPLAWVEASGGGAVEAPVTADANAPAGGRMAAREELVRRRELLRKHGGKGTEDALQAALTWLAAHQSPTGEWDTDGYMRACGSIGKDECVGAGQPHQDVGVTGLALLALAGAGSSAAVDGEFSEHVRKGVEWLASRQDAKTGRLGPRAQHDFVYGHAIGTLALLEAGDRSHPKLRERIQRAVDYIVSAQNDGMAWRYDVPPIKSNDTSVTGWMVSVLSVAKREGFDVPNECFTGALNWIDQVTEEKSGRVGYDSIGSFSSRTTMNDQFPRGDAAKNPMETLTAVGLWTRLACGQDPAHEPRMSKHARLLFDHPPVFEAGEDANDMYGWYYGTYAMFQLGGSQWKSWNDAMKVAVVGSQREDDTDASGSWDPVGPWGYAGGRVYSTALMALCLEVYWRYPRFLDG